MTKMHDSLLREPDQALVERMRVYEDLLEKTERQEGDWKLLGLEPADLACVACGQGVFRVRKYLDGEMARAEVYLEVLCLVTGEKSLVLGSREFRDVICTRSCDKFRLVKGWLDAAEKESDTLSD